MTPEEIQKVEDIVNSIIEQGLQVRCDEMPWKKRKIGAEGLFKEKYGDIVKVYSIGISAGRYAEDLTSAIPRNWDVLELLRKKVSLPGCAELKLLLLEKSDCNNERV